MFMYVTCDGNTVEYTDYVPSAEFHYNGTIADLVQHGDWTFVQESIVNLPGRYMKHAVLTKNVNGMTRYHHVCIN